MELTIQVLGEQETQESWDMVTAHGEQELNHSDGQAEKFYRDLKQRGICVRVGLINAL